MPPKGNRGAITAAARLKFIDLKRSVLRDQLTDILDRIAQNINITQLKLRLNELTESFYEYKALHEELLMDHPEHGGIDEMTSIRDDYFNVATLIEERSPSTNNDIPMQQPVSNSSGSERQKILKLPTAPLPIFSGNYNEWLSFISQFEALVDVRTDITDSIKFVHLQGALKGQAASKIAHLIPSNENYAIAKKILIDSYDKKRILITKYCDAILDIEKSHPQTSEALTSLVDETRLNLTALESLKVKFEPLVVIRLLERALPRDVRQEWEKTLDLDHLPTLDQICNFINETVYRMETIENKSELSNKRSGVNNTQSKKFRKLNHGERSFVTQGQKLCKYCKRDHYTSRCDEFNALSLSERWEAVRSKKMCRNCLREDHSVCDTKARCKLCNRYHHTLLHDKNKDTITGNVTTSS